VIGVGRDPGGAQLIDGGKRGLSRLDDEEHVEQWFFGGDPLQLE